MVRPEPFCNGLGAAFECDVVDELSFVVEGKDPEDAFSDVDLDRVTPR